MLSFTGFKGCITVKWCHFLYLPECSTRSNNCLSPLSHNLHITEDWKNVPALQYYHTIVCVFGQNKYCDCSFCCPVLLRGIKIIEILVQFYLQAIFNSPIHTFTEAVTPLSLLVQIYQHWSWLAVHRTKVLLFCYCFWNLLRGPRNAKTRVYPAAGFGKLLKLSRPLDMTLNSSRFLILLKRKQKKKYPSKLKR